MPDGPPEKECGLYVVHLDPNRAMVLHSNSHLPLSWRQKYDVDLDWSWAFVLLSSDDGRTTRFLFRSRRAETLYRDRTP